VTDAMGKYHYINELNLFYEAMAGRNNMIPDYAEPGSFSGMVLAN
jgi:hypothetical protein